MASLRRPNSASAATEVASSQTKRQLKAMLAELQTKLGEVHAALNEACGWPHS